MTAPLVEVTGLAVDFPSRAGPVHALRGVDLTVERGEVLGVVGESGSGKTITMLALLGLLPGAADVHGSIRYDGRELLGLPSREMRKLRGARIGMIFQDPTSALNPVLPVGRQITEGIRVHHRAVTRRAASARAVELLGLMGIPEPHRRVGDYPHQLSGGMCQRVMIALALANDPELLIADEPTTALDVTIQAQILELLRGIATERRLTIVLISHDLGVVAGLADRVSVMYAGRVVERGPVRDVYHSARHPYTRGLLASVPRLHESERQPLTSIGGSAPSLLGAQAGCAFAPRCPHATPGCVEVDPRLRPVGPVEAACIHAEDLDHSSTAAP